MSQAVARTFGSEAAPSPPKAPAHLSAAAKRWWRSMVEEFELEPHHVPILTAAAEAFDRKEEARRLLAEEGIVIRTGTDTPIPHPAVEIEDAASLRMVRLIGELRLDGTPAPDVRLP